MTERNHFPEGACATAGSEGAFSTRLSDVATTEFRSAD